MDDSEKPFPKHDVNLHSELFGDASISRMSKLSYSYGIN